MDAAVTNLTALTAADAARRIARGEIASEQLVQACLDRASEREDEVRAWEHLDPAHALAQARERDEWRASGRSTGPLHGLPVAIKDIIDTADMPTCNGTKAHAGRQPRDDAAVVSALRDAGAVIMGKTVTTELANMTPGKTRNPHNPEHTPGGSSSGSAAAVADGMVPLALGTQTAGSVIRPASFCGIFGFKPTFGLISRRGVLKQSEHLDTVGVYGRSIEDVALIADCLTAFDPTDRQMWPRSRPALRDVAMTDPPLEPTIAFVKSPAWEFAEPEMAEAFGELTDALGERCDEVELPSIFDKALEWQQVIQNGEMAKNYATLEEKHADLISEGLKGRLAEGRAYSAVEYSMALEFQDILYGGIAEIFDRYDMILTPASCGPAPRGLETSGNPVFNAIWTYLGAPAVTVPLLEVDGMPLGVQLAGPCRDDARLLRNARWLVEHLVADAHND